jgi:hypothetical protein
MPNRTDIHAILTTALRHTITGPNLEAGFEQVSALTGSGMDYGAFCEAVADCLHEGLIREPVRLPEGALQCHWHLELTPSGVTAARALQRGASIGQQENG